MIWKRSREQLTNREDSTENELESNLDFKKEEMQAIKRLFRKMLRLRKSLCQRNLRSLKNLTRWLSRNRIGVLKKMKP